MQFAENIQDNWQKEYCFVMTNARTHTARPTQEGIQEQQYQLLEHPPYSPDMTPSDFHLFDPHMYKSLVANVLLMIKRLKWKRRSG
jgi:hypothetical protein